MTQLAGMENELAATSLQVTKGKGVRSKLIKKKGNSETILWKMRNEKVFAEGHPREEDIEDEICRIVAMHCGRRPELNAFIQNLMAGSRLLMYVVRLYGIFRIF